MLIDLCAHTTCDLPARLYVNQLSYNQLAKSKLIY
nr:MAG TPA: hypothetical protein [Crassvirales sp.]